MPGKELDFQNGTVVDSTPKIRLACTRCHTWRNYDREGDTVVRCGECGKRHSTSSLWDTNVAGVTP